MAIYGDGKHNENMEHVSKQDFGFYVDRKVTIWVREHHHIKSDSYENACKEMIESFHDNLCSETFSEQEFLLDTEELLEPGDNGGQPTIELFGENGADILADNIKTN
jgi:hypothetical protein